MKTAYFYALGAILLWSTAATGFKISLQHLSFVELLSVASFTATCVLFLIILFSGKMKLVRPTSKQETMQSLLLGFVNPFIYYLMLLKAYSVLPAQVAQPVNYTWPVMLVLLSVPLLKQPLTTRGLIAVLLGFCGVVVISLQGNVTNINIQEPWGVALAASSSVVWALFWIFNVRDKRDEVVKLFWNFAVGAFCSWLFIFLSGEFRFLPWQGIGAAVYIGVTEMALGFVFWLKAMQLAPSNDRIGNLVFLSPFISLVFIHFVVGEEIYFTTLIGLVVIIAGIVLQQTAPKEKKSAEQ